MNNKTSPSRGENWGIKAAHGTKWLMRKLKAFDKYCVAKAKNKNRPSWLGHIPLASVTLAVITFLAYFSLFILLVLGLLVLLFSIVANIGNFSSENIDSEDKDIFCSQTEDDYSSVYMHGNQGDGWYTDDSGTIKLDD